MKRSKFTDEQISYVLRQVEGGTAVADVCRQVGISEATFYIWKKKYASLGGTEIRELRQLREENAKLADELRLLRQKVEDYRKKAAGFGGLFSSSSKRSDAMYALLLENEALEEALFAQNEKLKQERTDALRGEDGDTAVRACARTARGRLWLALTVRRRRHRRR